MNFWDTSALVPLNFDEPQRPQALQILEADDPASIGFVCFDARLNEAAAREGLWIRAQ